MSRRPVSDQKLSQTAGYFNLIVGDPPKTPRRNELDEPSTAPSKKSPPRSRNFDRSFREACDYARKIVEGVWEAQTPAHLVGLYAVLHEHVFGVLPLELKQDFQAAVSSAGKLCRDEFGGDVLATQRFVAWCWARVNKRRKRSSPEDDTFRPGWRLQFKSRNWLTDYKADGHRRTG